MNPAPNCCNLPDQFEAFFAGDCPPDGFNEPFLITRIGETEDLHEAIALNTYARAELARLVAIRTRIKAAHTQPLSEEQLAMAAAQAAERQFMDFTLESLR